MKEITIKLYDYDELSINAQERALADWAKDVDDPMLQSHMINLLKEELEERGIKYDVDSIDVRYSLSHCQGDGFMFEGRLEFEGQAVTVKHSGRYYHSYSKQVDWPELDLSGAKEQDEEARAKRFEDVYQSICKKMEEVGYAEIEYQQSAEAFGEACEGNGYTFEADGTMRNA